jgi:hypothetical protein
VPARKRDELLIGTEGDRIHLCPDSGELSNTSPLATIDVLFTCASTVMR